MHELSIALGIINVAEEELQQQGGGEIVAVHLKVGVLSGVVVKALRSAFELACEGSPLERSTLLIENTPVAVFCPHCKCEQPVESSQELRCVECGSYASEIVKGHELEIVAMEIES